MNQARKFASPAEAEIEKTDLWLALTSLPRPHIVIPFPRMMPGTDVPIAEVVMWPLKQEEQAAAAAEADRFTKKILQDPQRKDEANLGYAHIYTNEVAIQTLYRACRDPKSEPEFKRAAFPSPSLMRKEFTTDEVGVLFNHYCTVQSELGPISAHMTQEEEEALILRISKVGSAYPFDTLSWEEQKALVLSMASRLVSCWMVTSSLGSQPSVTGYALSAIAELLEEEQKAAPPQDDAATTEPTESEPTT